MVIKDVNLETVCGITSKFPDNDKIEIAFAGKSNVGKSSLINSLMNRKNLARTSAQPGKTQTVNFYHVSCYHEWQAKQEDGIKTKERTEGALYFVDLPGYGYARANEEVKAQWGKMIEKYLHTSKMLKVVFLLIDIRHEPSANDKHMYQWILDQGYEPVIIATKLDKINRSQVQKHIKMLKQGLNVVKGTVVIPFSAETKQGREEIYAYIDGICLKQ
ncbi:MAG: ribosome biogenesis GTP-binding protein YsxC [Lachnospiraceae bacterium]|nr:ribosome biogenesis GTP-binding protein YsxC [Lachnospiraceae bacterium]MBR3806945.1 ribosome biogenesis GTP-binding protein YsxC [Lachnospiraceae bacterium]